MMQQSEKITLPEIASKRRHSRLRTGIQKSRMTGRKTGEQKMQFIGFSADTTAAYLPDLRLDAGHCVAERNEANNTTYQGNVVRDCQNIHVHVPKANLTVWRGVGANYAPHPSDITLNGLSDNGQPVNGVTMPLMAIVTNNGEATATNVRTLLRRQPFGLLISAGVPNGFTLEPGASQTVTFNWTPSGNNYYLEAVVDPQNIVVEYDENDNTTNRDIPELEVIDIKTKE